MTQVLTFFLIAIIIAILPIVTKKTLRRLGDGVHMVKSSQIGSLSPGRRIPGFKSQQSHPLAL